MNAIVDKMRADGQLKIATDHPDYQIQIRQLCLENEKLWSFSYETGNNQFFCEKHDIWTNYARHAVKKNHIINIFHGSLK
jgi:tRNA G46 methylase TrmB